MLIGEQSFEVSSPAARSSALNVDLDCDLTHTVTSSRRELALSPTCQPRGKVVSTKVGCGRYGNQAGRASLRRIRGGSAMTTRTPLAALIEARMQQLALDRAALGLRLGYQNPAKAADQAVRYDLKGNHPRQCEIVGRRGRTLGIKFVP